MAITGQFLLGLMVNAVPSSACGCRKADLIRLSLGPLACPQGTASLPVPKQAPDSPNPINRNSTSVSTSTTHGTLTGSMCRRLSCSCCRKPWTSIVFVECVFNITVCMIAPDLCQGSKKVRDPGFAESKVWNLDGSWTLHGVFAVGLWKPRTSKLCYAAWPWKPRTSRFWYAVRPWKPQDLKILIVARPWKTQDLKIWICDETLETQDPEPQNFDVLRLKDLGPYTIQYRISCWVLCQGVQQVMNSDDRTPKIWILKNNTTYRTHPAGGRW